MRDARSAEVSSLKDFQLRSGALQRLLFGPPAELGLSAAWARAVRTIALTRPTMTPMMPRPMKRSRSASYGYDRCSAYSVLSRYRTH